MHPREPDVLGHPTRPRSVSVGLDYTRDLAHLRPDRPRYGIQVDAQLVGTIEIVGTDRVGVQLETRAGWPADKRPRRSRHHFFGAAPDGEAQRHDLDPRQGRLDRWRPLR